jgi:hypothetical protein
MENLRKKNKTEMQNKMEGQNAIGNDPIVKQF